MPQLEELDVSGSGVLHKNASARLLAGSLPSFTTAYQRCEATYSLRRLRQLSVHDNEDAPYYDMHQGEESVDALLRILSRSSNTLTALHVGSKGPELLQMLSQCTHLQVQ